jgi:hypothetical protein
MNHDSMPKTLGFKLTVLFALFVVFVIWLFYVFFIHHLEPAWTKSGQFGDTFGGLDPLFTGWAFVGIMVALFEHSRELKNSRDEIEEQRALQKKTQELLFKQVEALSHTAHVEAMATRLTGSLQSRHAKCAPGSD